MLINYGNQILAAIAHCPEKNNTLELRDNIRVSEALR